MSSSTPTVADYTQLISELRSGVNFFSAQQRAHSERAVDFLLEKVRVGSASGMIDAGIELPKWVSAYTALPTSDSPIIGVRLDDGAVRIAWVGRWRGGVALRVHHRVFIFKETTPEMRERGKNYSHLAIPIDSYKLQISHWFAFKNTIPDMSKK
jgi:hypothetical protein